MPTKKPSRKGKGKGKSKPRPRKPSRHGKSSPKTSLVDRVREEILKADPGAFVCPYCRSPLNWQTVGSTEVELSIYVREKILFCPQCRAFLGVSSWHPQG